MSDSNVKEEAVKVSDVVELRNGRSVYDKTAVNCYEQFRQTYKEVPPLAVDPQSGDIMNKTHDVQLVKSDPIDIQDDIDSYFDSVDLKTNIVRLSKQGIDPVAALNVPCADVYADISQLPDNINDWKAFFADKAEQKAALDIQIAEAKKLAAEAEASKQKSLEDAIASKVAEYMANKESK